MATVYGIKAEWIVRPGPPPTHNDLALFDALVPKLDVISGVNVVATTEHGMFAEDFAFYTVDIPALYFALGVAKAGLGEGTTHSTQFTIHPDALEVGVSVLTNVAQIATQTLPPQP